MVKREFTVGDVAKLTGLTTQTIRHWDKTGKLVPARGNFNVRVYSEADVKRAVLIASTGTNQRR
jgi:DNA-binding transcriptional MerR regulator